MLQRPHETEEYQDYLISEQRKGVISPELYNILIPDFKDGLIIIDFGCGLGYTSIFYADKFSEKEDFHIYACDYQVEVLDLFWKRIADGKYRNITPFFMPDQSRLHLPNWIPKADHLFFSLSLSASENPVDILKTIQPLITEKTLIHILDWDPSKSHPHIDEMIPPRKRLGVETLKPYLDLTGYQIIREYKTAGPYFALTARLVNPLNKPTPPETPLQAEDKTTRSTRESTNEKSTGTNRAGENLTEPQPSPAKSQVDREPPETTPDTTNPASHENQQAETSDTPEGDLNG